MARYFSVDEAAQILGTTDRTVRRMLGSGRLAGSQYMDKGKLVWRVHASKEILEKICPGDIEKESQIVDVLHSTEQVDFEPPNTDARAWQQEAQSQIGSVAETFWNEIASKFMERIELKDQVIGSLRSEIEDKDRQLRLLPDLQKQAEAERQAAENKALEVEALKKQIAALEEKQAIAVEHDRRTAEEHAQAWKEQIAALKERQTTAIEQERRIAEEANSKAAILSKQAEQLELEMLRIKSEKESEAKAVNEQLSALKKQLEELKQPWWKKWFAPGRE